jgi:hypothetical protein
VECGGSTPLCVSLSFSLSCGSPFMLPGACHDWFTVQHFVEVEDGDAAVAWATPDAPLACFQDLNRGKWQTSLPWTNGHIYAYVMNNYWFTNYLAGQGGEFVFRFAITSGPKGDRVTPARFGADASNPLTAVVTDTNPAGKLPRRLPAWCRSTSRTCCWSVAASRHPATA